MKWFDAGVNLLDGRFNAEEVIARSVDAGVDKLCAITTEPAEWDAARALHIRFPEHVVYTIGCHPHNAKVMTDDDFVRLEDYLGGEGVVAVGECGLDFNRDFSPRDVQERVFRRQLQIAVKHQMPVYLHERDAHALQLRCLDEDAAGVKGIAHCFTGQTTDMQAYLQRGLHIGITGWVCDPKRGEALREAVKSLPLEKLIVETDAPYLFPKHHRPRARNNEPAFLPSIGCYLSDLLEISAEDIAQTSYANTCRLFNIAG
ncbi:TatD family hydrolase [Alteromonas confluentis]|uniref:Hydrolase TatD n=1 Tax=Alteromonas confluentis TaxID=1656094 RepID=A0A1E7Z896_9ALTE|nr:TatD family hydrolase [Alteromonas confluentis]OFC69765.1 hydrolase TatD [Alteromonas confluentis]